MTACNNVHSAFAKTDNLEVMIAPTRSRTNTADNWRIVHSCPDTGSGICLVALNVAQQTGILLNPVDNSKVYMASGHAMTISGIAKALVKIEDSVKICEFWVTPMMRDRLLLSRQQLMTFNIIPKTFPKIMRPKDGDTLMCQTCANIVRQSHFEKLGKNHFVSLVDKNAPDGKVNSRDFYRSVISKACGPCQKAIIKHHFRKLPHQNKTHVVSAVATKLALATTTTSMDMETEEFDRIKARLIFKWPRTLLGFNHIDAPPLKAKMLANAPPCHTSAARRIPHNYLEQAGEMIATLLKEGVIERSPEATSWTSPAFFIPKNDRTKLRFIVDLSYLNGFLIRSIHEFPTP